jgi:hypothetical protein
MKLLLSVFFRVCLVVLLTVITQIGGVIYLIYKPLGIYINKKITHKYFQLFARLAAFMAIYCFFSILIVPLIAQKVFNRVPLPYFSTEKLPLKPQLLLTCFANRHYVRVAMYEVMKKQTLIMRKKYANTEIVYLDANFPFFDGFPLLPHLSHNDGKKLDLAFLYTDQQTGQRINASPSTIGYGVCEEPKQNEINRPKECAEKGYWQYSFLTKIVSQSQKDLFVFDAAATKYFIKLLINDKRVGKILIETHLKNRLALQNEPKIRLQGCISVRHDDHFHIQLQ